MSGGAANFIKCGSVLVTGANRGLGLELVERLASGGFSPGKIIATTRNTATAEKLQELAEKHPNIHIVTLDVVNQDSIEKCAADVAQLVQEEGLNCLINNAGINVVADFHSVTAEKMIENFHTNSVAPLMITKAFLPLLKRAASRGALAGSKTMSIQRAAVINMSSLLGSVELNWGERGNTFKWYPYRTSKWKCKSSRHGLAAQQDGKIEEKEELSFIFLITEPTWMQSLMVTIIDLVAPVELISSSGELKMPFSDAIKYSILAISVTLLLLALGILAWQIFRCCTQTHNMYNQHDTVSSNLLYTDEKPTTAGNYSGAPSTKVEDVSTEAHRLSRCLSQTSFPSSGSSQRDEDMGEQESIKKVDGSLRFSVYYDRLQSRLVVTVLQVEGLLQLSQTCSLQPFVKLRLMWAGSETVEVEGFTNEEGEETLPVLWTVLQEWRTRTVKGSCSPLYGDQFSCVLQEDKLHHVSLRMEVKDFDKFSRHTVLGEVRLPIGQLNIFYPLELQEELQVPQKDLVGEVLLSLKFLPTSQRLEVGLLKVRMVLTEMCSDAALYARISVQCNQCKLRYQKTSAVARCLVTVFNQVLMFSLPEFPVEQGKISISVYETHTARKSTKRLIGQLSVGKERSKEDEHWTSMMRSVRQPVAKWHSLLI
ncbi:synaptotagmin-1-like isoform X2 [Acanthochromis polyacanthus]|nr:synaptotagmin-1-like isoform X2 [Acanthochromis polyacanthus]